MKILVRKYEAAADWAALRQKFVADASWPRGGRVYCYLESVSRCSLTEEDPSAWTPEHDALEGRLFGGHADVRWLLAGSEFHAWLTREGTGADDERTWTQEDIHEVDKTCRDYYLLGKATSKPGAFHEARYPAAFRYPVTGGKPDTDRASIHVAEYRRAKPSWSGDVAHIDEQLGAPLLIAHRFVRVEVR